MKNSVRFKKRWRAAAFAAALFLSMAGMVRETAAAVHFPDVTGGAYYYGAVSWAVENGTATGRGGYFKPDDICTRAEAVSFLYKLAGSPAVSGAAPFPDAADPNAWYRSAVIWAVNNNITSGYGTKDGVPIFSPGAACTRAMIVSLIRNFAQYEQKYRAVSAGDVPFPDVPKNAWYRDTVRWAVRNGITHGKGDGKFYPDEGCTRGQIVCFIYNYRHLPEYDDGGGDIETPDIPID